MKSSSAADAVVEKIKKMYAESSVEEKQLLITLLTQAEHTSQKGGQQVPLKVAPDRTIMLGVGQGSQCW